MTTLIDKEIFDYLAHLEGEVNKRISASNERNLQHLMHSQMREVVMAERNFLKYINSNGTQPILSISPNGLPSIASLNPDLEKMCELIEHEPSFGDVAQRFKKGVNGKNNDGEERHLYVPVSGEEWSRELANRGEEKLQSQVGFAISETDDGRFELAIREDIHLQGYDQHSKEFPVLIREGKMRYHVVWNRLIEDIEESFYVPNTSLVLQGRPIKPPKKQFDDLTRFYGFGKKDYKSYNGKMPILFWRSWTPDNYSKFLNAGTNSRVAITNQILKMLEESLGKQVNLKSIRKEDLEVTLSFASIPFENAPQTTPKQGDLYGGIDYNKGRLTPKVPVRFDLIFKTGAEKMGEIQYVLPYNEYFDTYSGNYYRFALGGVHLYILGSAIPNELQFEKLQNCLKIKKKE